MAAGQRAKLHAKWLYPVLFVSSGKWVRLVMSDGEHEYVVQMRRFALQRLLDSDKMHNVISLRREPNVPTRVARFLANRGLVGRQWMKEEEDT